MGNTKQMKLITLHLPYKTLEFVDRMVEEGYYPNRSEALRFFILHGIRELLDRQNLEFQFFSLTPRGDPHD